MEANIFVCRVPPERKFANVHKRGYSVDIVRSFNSPLRSATREWRMERKKKEKDER